MEAHTDKSTDRNAADAIAAIPAYQSVDELVAYIDGDTRKTVLDAAAARIGELGGDPDLIVRPDDAPDSPAVAPAPSSTAPILPATIGGPEVALANEQRLEPADQPKVKDGVAVAVRWPVDYLDTGIEGVALIRQDPTLVPRAKLEDIRVAAGSAGVELIEGE